MARTWDGNTECNLCGIKCEESEDKVIIDSPTRRGTWATMCLLCYFLHSGTMTLDTGMASLYKWDGKEFVKVPTRRTVAR